jgi:hypothetical protein
MDYHERYAEFTDDQILDILRHHKDYQEAAVEVAVKIAIERQLINSEQDLFSLEFQNIRSTGSRLFPEIPNDFHRQKLIGSIFRFLYMMSFLPLVFGFLKYAEGQLYLTFIGVGSALIWFLLSYLLSKTHKQVMFIPIFLLLFTVSFGTGWHLISNTTFHLLDFVMLFIGTLLPVYLLLLLRKLIHPKTESER